MQSIRVMTQEKLLHIFLQEADIVQDDEDGIAVGSLRPCDSPAGVQSVMEWHTKNMDALLQVLPDGVDKIEVLIRRGFTFAEYQMLFDSTIRENSFNQYPVFRSLWITSERERRRWTFTYSKDSHDDYMTVLSKVLQGFAPSLLTFFFTGRHNSQGFRKTSLERTRVSRRKVRSWKV